MFLQLSKFDLDCFVTFLWTPYFLFFMLEKLYCSIINNKMFVHNLRVYDTRLLKSILAITSSKLTHHKQLFNSIFVRFLLKWWWFLCVSYFYSSIFIVLVNTNKFKCPKLYTVLSEPKRRSFSTSDSRAGYRVCRVACLHVFQWFEGNVPNGMVRSPF